MRAAIETGDSDKLERTIDFPKVRESLKEHLKARMMEEMASSGEDGAETTDVFAQGLAMVFGPAIIDGMVDNYVTPSGFSKLFREGAIETENEENFTSVEEEEMPKIKFAFFQSLSRFRADYENDSSIILERSGLSWRLVRFAFPEEGEAEKKKRLK